jgi:succinyl-CoA synthetase beta subunit
MRLYEFEGKALLSRHGVPTPHGVITNDPGVPNGAPVPAAVKAQVLSGKRGKRGAIRLVNDRAALEIATAALLDMVLDDEPVERVLVEERLSIARELYLSLYVDRISKSAMLMATPHGGIDVEDVAASAFVRLPVHPFTGLRPYHVRAVRRVLGLPSSADRDLDVVIGGMWAAFSEVGATLVEINPLVLTVDGRLVAADAKVTIDDRVADGAPQYRGERSGLTAYEREAASRRAVGIDVGGEIAIITTGAGILMATADSVSARGGRLGPLLDLGGFPRSRDQEAALFGLVLMAEPRVVLFNFFTQVMRCDQFAEAAVAAFGGRRGGPRIVARLKGFKAAEGREILAASGMCASESYETACDLAVAAATAEVPGVGTR